MQGGWQPPPGGGGYGPPGGYGQPPPGGMGGPPGYGPPNPYGGAPNPYGGAPPNPYGGVAPPMPGGMPGQGYGNYEFNDLENSIISKAASRASMWGWIAVALGALQFFGYSCGGFASPSLWTSVPMAIVLFVVGLVFVGVGNSLKSVVNTQGNDIKHMMEAIQKMGSAFLIQSIAWIIMAVLTAIFVVLAIFVIGIIAATS